MSVNDVDFLLAQGQPVDELRRAVDAAVRAGGGFVDFVVVGNRAVSVLVSPASHVVISVEMVEFDPRDTGDDAEPYGGAYDML
jgi:hypothetical protein